MWGLGPKGPLFVTKWAKMRFYEGVRSKRSTFWGPPPQKKVMSDYMPDNIKGKLEKPNF